MIHFDSQTGTFNLILNSSYYAFQVDEQGRLVHLGWGLRPAEAQATDLISGRNHFEPYDLPWSFITQFRPDEILTYGDVTTYGITLKASFPTDGLPIRDLRLRYMSHEVVAEARPGLAPATAPTRPTLRVCLQDPAQPVQVIACYRPAPDQDLIERWLELKNVGDQPITFEVCHFASLHLPAGFSELTTLSGSWAREFTPTRRPLTIGSQTIESRSLQTSHHHNPFFLLTRPGQASEEYGLVYFGALAYSGSWQLVFEQLPTWHIRVHGGYNPFDSELVLAPGQSHCTPAFVAGVSPEGWGGASRRLHAFAQQWLLAAGRQPRPVLYNSWEATYFNLSQENQIELARKAAAIGVELFCLDDGWFGARRNDTAGLGDWRVSPQAFPNGLEPLIAEVQRLGMRFGLWVEPEMVNPDSDLYRQHPDWVLHFPGRERTQSRNQLILDFGRPEVVDYIYHSLEALASQYAISFFKWDMNRLATEPGSVVGKAIWYQHVAAVYQIMDRLRQKHPHLDIQSCSGGGGRADLGILGRTEQIWISDNTDAFDRTRIQEGFSLAYPAQTMEAWVTHHHNHITQRLTPLSLRFDVAMRGVLGIGSSLNELSQSELAEYAQYIAFYKRIRHLVQGGRLYRLQRLEEFGASIVQYVAENGQEAVYSLVVHDHQVGTFRPNPPLKGLRPGVTYTIRDWGDRELQQATGYQLMTLGLPRLALDFVGYSQTLYLKNC